jgi:hypothetical protein
MAEEALAHDLEVAVDLLRVIAAANTTNDRWTTNIETDLPLCDMVRRSAAEPQFLQPTPLSLA